MLSLLKFGQIEMETLTGQKLWFRGRFLGIGAIVKNGDPFEGPIFAVDDDIFMLITGAGNSPNAFFCEFIRLDETPKPVTIETAELVLRPLDRDNCCRLCGDLRYKRLLDFLTGQIKDEKQRLEFVLAAEGHLTVDEQQTVLPFREE